MSEQAVITPVAAQPRSGKVMYLDVIRAWSTLWVLLLHVSQFYETQDPSSVGFVMYNLIHSIGRTVIPGFLMISGALLLDENYRCSGRKLKKMILNRSLFFVIWSVLYALCFGVLKPLAAGEPVSLWTVLDLSVNGYVHLWFIPMLLGLYLILPLLRLWVKTENRKYVEYFLILSLIFTSILPFLTEKLADLFPNLGFLAGIHENLALQYTAGYTGYFILGWYLHNFPPKNRKAWYALGLGSMLMTFLGTQIFTVIKGEPRNFYSTFAVNIALHSAAHFLLIKTRLGTRQFDNSRFSRFVQFVCVNSMGIYAIHPFVIQLSYKLLGLRNALVMIPLVSGVTFGVSVMGTWILRKIPIAKDYMV